MTAHGALMDFVDYWRGTNGFVVHPTGNCEFRAQVAYSFGGNVVVDITMIQMIRNGFDDGTVRLDEAPSLPAASFHLDFSPTYQTYQFRGSDGAFVISGKSRKMAGKYSVTMKPTV